MGSSILVTMIGRLGDGLMLAASLDDEVAHGRLLEPQARAKQLLRKLNHSSPPRASLETQAFTVHYLLDQDVIYLCICERNTSQNRAFAYLQDVGKHFFPQYQDKIKSAVRPYCFIEFDTFIKGILRSAVSREVSSSIRLDWYRVQLSLGNGETVPRRPPRLGLWNYDADVMNGSSHIIKHLYNGTCHLQLKSIFSKHTSVSMCCLYVFVI
ncbi:unnamed protein product, partial [Meganyctiphanes norvegica]